MTTSLQDTEHHHWLVYNLETTACACAYLDVAGVCEEHGHSVDAEAPPPCGGQTVLESSAEILVYQLSFIVSCSLVLGSGGTDEVGEGGR